MDTEDNKSTWLRTSNSLWGINLIIYDASKSAFILFAYFIFCKYIFKKHGYDKTLDISTLILAISLLGSNIYSVGIRTDISDASTFFKSAFAIVLLGVGWFSAIFIYDLFEEYIKKVKDESVSKREKFYYIKMINSIVFGGFVVLLVAGFFYAGCLILKEILSSIF